jgi:hypothetical protein
MKDLRNTKNMSFQKYFYALSEWKTRKRKNYEKMETPVPGDSFWRQNS